MQFGKHGNGERALISLREVSFFPLAQRDKYTHRRIPYNAHMARWPRHVWTSIFTYATVFLLFPLLCLLAYAWVRGWIF
jgi:hypothetical protein